EDSTPTEPEQAFLYGTTGTELLPLPVLQVLPDLFPENFQPAGKDKGDWIRQFGFIRRTDSQEGLPVGFSVSHFRPRSGSPSPLKFVGINCSLCHTSKLKRYEADDGVLIHGMGNLSLDFIAWVDALKSSLLDENRATLANITAAYKMKYGSE